MLVWVPGILTIAYPSCPVICVSESQVTDQLPVRWSIHNTSIDCPNTTGTAPPGPPIDENINTGSVTGSSNVMVLLVTCVFLITLCAVLGKLNISLEPVETGNTL